jgi:hypothetical protein
MGEILGIGGSHFPGLVMADQGIMVPFHQILAAPNVDPRYRDRANWPPEMIAEMGQDEGLTATRELRRRLFEDCRKLRRIIDDFEPDFIVIFGDDQYENFREDIIPPFCIFGLDDDFDEQPYAHDPRFARNAWGEPTDFTLHLHGHRAGAKYLASGLMQRGFPMSYAYKTLNQPHLAHAFTNTVLFLDCDRIGFPHRVVPFHVNCYGSQVITAKGFAAHLFETQKAEGLPDPPGPSPALCMELGAKLAQVASESPYRIVLMASAGWSHAFLSPTNGYIIPDHQADRMLLEALKRGDYETWRKRTPEENDRAGHQELLAWMVLVGAMAELGRKPVVHDFHETYIFRSNNCFASFPPG